MVSCFCSDEEVVAILSSPEVVEVPPLSQGGEGASSTSQGERAKTEKGLPASHQGVSTYVL